ncbi:Dual specificity phosphatase, catalytic domain [compost metagenome]
MAGKSIAIHCKGGSGRTGLFAARLMIECGIPVHEAIAQVQALRPRAIQNPAHVSYINQFTNTL